MTFHTTHKLVYQAISDTIKACQYFTGISVVELIVDNGIMLYIDKDSSLQDKYELYCKTHKKNQDA